MQESFCDVLEKSSIEIHSALQGLNDVLPTFYSFLQRRIKFLKAHIPKILLSDSEFREN
jgi:hypothetical protein